jgi:hypothetical protein
VERDGSERGVGWEIVMAVGSMLEALLLGVLERVNITAVRRKRKEGRREGGKEGRREGGKEGRGIEVKVLISQEIGDEAIRQTRLG